MKYIKSKKTFEAKVYGNRLRNGKPDELVEDIKDICLELEDKGYLVEIHSRANMLSIIFIQLIEQHDPYRTSDSHFKLNDIQEEVDRIKEYLGSKMNSISGIDDNGKEFKIQQFKSNGIYGIKGIENRKSLTSRLEHNSNRSVKYIKIEYQA